MGADILESGFKACGLVPANRNEEMKAFNKLVTPSEVPNTFTLYSQEQRQKQSWQQTPSKLRKESG